MAGQRMLAYEHTLRHRARPPDPEPYVPVSRPASAQAAAKNSPYVYVPLPATRNGRSPQAHIGSPDGVRAQRYTARGLMSALPGRGRRSRCRSRGR
ncbi:hypothetical protein GCM10020367_27700 [Streptomyces sannanensis]|uniref:Uncharacterized protein n=1 Tax=Streptomyces sannanensis TaxID=285536 RepID=A0ABP6SBK5_9ACTN